MHTVTHNAKRECDHKYVSRFKRFKEQQNVFLYELGTKL